MDLTKGDAATVSRLTCGVHTGTHVDAPFHFIDHGATLDQIALNRWSGEALVIKIDHPRAITVDELVQKMQDETPIERLLFKTVNSQSRWFEEPFNRDFVHLELAAAQWLMDRGIRLIGIDYLSVESFHAQDAPVHKALLGAEVLILEGLYLADAPVGPVELACLPMHLLNADGAPTRAVIRSV
jgi:arylformamidase